MSGWRFLLDENVDPRTATYLEKEDIHAEHVRDAIGLGADDETDIRPYAREHGAIILTSDLSDFAGTDADAVILHDDTMPAYEVAAAVLAMVDAYPGRGAFSGLENLDDWA